MSAEAVGRFLTVAEFAETVRLSPRKVYALLASREVAHNVHGDTYRIPESEVPAYLARTFVPAKPGEQVA